MTSTATRRTGPAPGPSKSGSLPPPASPLSAGAYPQQPAGPAVPRTGGRTQQGQTPAPAQTAVPASVPDDSGRGGGGGGIGEQASGALLALFLWPLLLNLVRGGPAQMWGWVKAKWINQPYGAPSTLPAPADLGATAYAALQQSAANLGGQGQQLAALGVSPGMRTNPRQS